MEPEGLLPCSQEPSIGPYLSRINPVHTTPLYLYLKSILILSTILRVGLPSCLFLSGFPLQNPIYIHLIRTTFPAHLILVDLTIRITRCIGKFPV
jgi:hypothetical protein